MSIIIKIKEEWKDKYSLICLALVLSNSSFAQTDVDSVIRTRYSNLDVTSESSEVLSTRFRFEFNHLFNEENKVHSTLDYVTVFLIDRYSDGVLLTENPVIVEPEGLRIHELYWAYNQDDWTALIGRRSIHWDDQRFISSFDDWQVGQSFDGITIKKSIFSNSQFQYDYSRQVNRFFGDDATPKLSEQDLRYDTLNGQRPTNELGQHRLNAHFLHFNYREFDYTQFSAYMIYSKNSDDLFSSQKMFGLRTEFTIKPSTIKYSALLDVAKQNQFNRDENKLVNYFLLEISAKYKAASFSLGREIFSYNDGVTFALPFSYLNSYQGYNWQYEILDNGLNDRYLEFGYRKKPIKFSITKHWFKNDSAQKSIGEQWDLSVRYRLSKDHQFDLTYSRFEPTSMSYRQAEVIQRLWLTYEYQWQLNH